MNKKASVLIVLILSAITGFSQPLFTYGDYQVSAAEFLRAYNKNNPQPVGGKAKSMREYLDLYINSRLKIREAYNRKYDTLPQVKTEVDNLRNQILENYMTDPETMNRLASEAFKRSQKDIHLGHIFIPVGNPDTTAAYNQAMQAYNRLAKAEDFLVVAQQLSQDPAVKTNKGDIGWITAFTLPYKFENAIYALAPGKFSAPVRSAAGYHIFKNLGERKAVGKMKAKQILLAFPPGADEKEKKQIALRADSLYKRIIAGDDFSKLALAFSNDYLTSVTGGSMPDFGVSQFEPAFEAKVWALAKDGAVTKPFLTSHGYHIVRRTSIVPVVTDPADRNYDQDLRQRIMLDPRWKTSREVIYEKVMQQAGFNASAYSADALWSYTDSVLDRKQLNSPTGITPEQSLFKLGDTLITVNNWIGFAQVFRYKSDGTGRKPNEQVMDEFIRSIAFQYYRDHLESFNDEFRFQMSEFRDGNLFFEIMQQEIWNRAHSDSAELRSLFETNKQKYNWDKSADAVIFFCADPTVAKTFHAQLKRNPSNWRSLADALSEKVVADSSRFEWTQLSGKNKIPVTGTVTDPVINATDNTASFAYIIKVYAQPSPRNYSEAKGLVINDYQALLEEQWLKKLREKYPVVINEAVFATLVK